MISQASELRLDEVRLELRPIGAGFQLVETVYAREPELVEQSDAKLRDFAFHRECCARFPLGDKAPVRNYTARPA